MANMIKHDSAEATKPDASPEILEGQKTEAVGPPKSQLRRRVEARIAELEAEFERVREDPTKQKQARALYMALKGVHDSMSESAENVGRMEAAQMSRWLDSVKYLGGN